MVRFVGASALALTMMTAAAQAAHRHHGGYAGFRSYHQARHSGAHRHYADARRSRRGYAVAREMAGPRESFEQDPPRWRDARQDAIAGAYASYHPNGGRFGEGRYAQRQVRRYSYDQPRLGGRPRAWCGWYARTLVGHDPGPEYNLARNWAHWGRAASPGAGVIVVWAHHVGMITGRTPDGQWIVRSGNDGGGAVRERPRSIAGAIAFRAG